jgi:hypothetical protein
VYRRHAGRTRHRGFRYLLIDGEEDRMLRAVLVGMLREAEELPQRARPHGEPAV